MVVLYGLPFAAVLILLIVSAKENLSEISKKDRVLIPFYKAVNKLNKVAFIRGKTEKWIEYMSNAYRPLYAMKDTRKIARKKCYKTLSQGLLIVAAGSFLAMVSAFSKSTNDIKELSRKETGGGSIIYELNALIDGENRTIPIKLGEKEYTKEEAEKWFKYGCENIENLILGENKSLDEVTLNLELITNLPDSSIMIDWECSNYSLIQPSGELCYENLTDEGQKVNLTAVFSYGEYEERHEMDVVVKKKTYSGIDGKYEVLREEINNSEAKDRTSKIYLLPDEIEGEKIEYTENKSPTEVVILVLAIIITCLLPFEEKSLIDKQRQERNRQMLLEYPELVCKLSLYLGAGMSIHKAWEKISLSYLEYAVYSGKRSYCNEEVVYTYRQIQSGALKTAAFEDFGNRCRLQPYKKLSMLINSNIRKGSSDLSEILQIESSEAMDTRKSTVIKLASEASAKLMMPMVLELVVVIGVLIIPAFMSIQF